MLKTELKKIFLNFYSSPLAITKAYGILYTVKIN